MSGLEWAWLLKAAIVAFFLRLYTKWWLPTWRRIQEYIRKCCTCGYLPPPPSPAAHSFCKLLSRVLLWIQVGRVRVLGAENLSPPGPFLVAPNHGHYIDAAPFALLLKQPARYMAAGQVFRFAGGLGALLVGPCGAFYANLAPGQGGGAREVAVEVLKSGQTLVMFPEGFAWMHGVMGPMKKGAVRIVKEAARDLGRTTYIVPAYMRYGAYPGEWILKYSSAFQFLLVFLGFFLFRSGLTIVIGKPISSDELPEDAEEATEYLRQRIVELDPRQLDKQAIKRAKTLVYG